MIPDPSDFCNASGEPYCASAPCTADDVPPMAATSGCPTTGPGTIDDVIEAAINSISADCLPSELDGHVRALCQTLLDHKAGTVVSNAAFDRLNTRLVALGRSKIGKRTWNTVV